MTKQYAVGIDVGGTKILAGVIETTSGEVVATARKRTHPERGADFFIERLLTVVQDAIGAAQLPSDQALAAIGIGIAGQVDREHGVLLAGPNLGVGLNHLPVAHLLRERFEVPVVLGNDVEVATRGEQTFGAARGCDDFVCVFVGTGIGSGIVQGGQVYRGATGTAGEIGHTVVQFGGRLCGCGGRGHLEAYASRSAVTKVLLAELARGRQSLLRDLVDPDDTAIRSKMIARCLTEGDEVVTEAVSEAADYLGVGLGSLISFYNPQRIVLGGGLIEATQLLFDRATTRAREVALPGPGRQVELVRTELGDNAGIVGAAHLSVTMPPSAPAGAGQ
ncbi:MAG TPA: ROK family protein [Ktedonobacterales bacterium]|nr:ROK family protein [Ktedonobacterales bacterium]